MLSARAIRVLIAGALFLHGIAHALALRALARQSLSAAPASWVAVRSWLFPTASPSTLRLPKLTRRGRRSLRGVIR